MPTITECPGCGRRLRLLDRLQGEPVRCPLCNTAFPARPLAEEGQLPSPAAPVSETPAEPDAPTPGLPEGPIYQLALEEGTPVIGAAARIPPAPAPLRPVLVETSATDGSVKAATSQLTVCPFCEERIAPQARICPHCGEDLRSERPEWERRGAIRRDCEPHRGGLVLTLGVVGLVASLIHIFCIIGLPLSIAAWMMGTNDLRDMTAGLMDPQGEGNTKAGKVCGMIGTVFGCLWALLFLLIALQIMAA